MTIGANEWPRAQGGKKLIKDLPDDKFLLRSEDEMDLLRI